MGCFLSCFRGAGSDPSGGLRDPLVRESRIGEAFLDDETKVEASGTLDGDRGNGGSVDEELMREANYLKSCGAIGETPPEMLEGSNQTTEEETNGELKGAAVSEENLSEGFNCDEHSALKHEQCIHEGTDHLLEVESVPQSSLQDKSSRQNIRNQRLDSNDSPHPTPLVLRGDMQTPGTLNTAYKESLRSGKRARTNKQFIYPVLRPIENKLQWMELRDDSSPVLLFNPPKRRYLSTDCSAKPQESITNTMATQTERITSASFSFHDITAGQDQGVISPEEYKSENDSRKLLDDADQLKYNPDSERKGVASLSCWLNKPPSSAGGSQSDTEGKVVKQRCYENSVFIDLPIFTASGLNWDNDKPTPVLPKVWDGNGIPNTTTKYKEDQKVSWHATPFEERLMKVLSDEKPHHQRKISGKLIQLDEETN
uniref:Protein JASON n=1 Tax=Oryza meridionalis TaxID=40149 RepID=A0A0E0CG88_9ORYZ